MEREEQVIRVKLQKLIDKMKELGYNDYMIGRAEQLVNELEQIGVYSVDKFVQKLLDRVDNKEGYLDILMEGRFAIILARLKFLKIQIEYCNNGPDIKANYNRNTVYFDVTRRRPNEDDLAVQSKVAIVSRDRAENIISKIQNKKSQLQSGETNIVVIWSDTVRLSQYELEEAFEYIKQEIEQNPGTYKDLSAILFTQGEESYRATLKKFYLFKNDRASKPLEICLTKKLESLRK